MIDLKNDLTLTFVWLIHNFELGFVDLKFRVLPTIGTIVTTGLDDLREFNISFPKETSNYNEVLRGKTHTIS